MKQFLETLKRHIAEHPPNFGDGDSVLTMLQDRCTVEESSVEEKT